MAFRCFSVGSDYLRFLREELAELKADPAEVAELIDSGQGVLLVSPDAFMVCRTDWLPDADPIIFVWLFYGRSKKTLERYWPVLERLGAEVGIRKVQCVSRRRGWVRLGWTITGMLGDSEYVLERDMSHGKQGVEQG